MISQEVTQRNVWPYLIGLILIIMVFLIGWAAIELIQTRILPLNLDSASVTKPSAEIHPADRKFFNNDYTASGSTSSGSGSWSDIDPADRKFFTNDYQRPGSTFNGTGASTEIDPADRKFYTQAYSE